jgi:hypothetical protein
MKGREQSFFLSQCSQPKPTVYVRIASSRNNRRIENCKCRTSSIDLCAPHFQARTSSRPQGSGYKSRYTLDYALASSRMYSARVLEKKRISVAKASPILLVAVSRNATLATSPQAGNIGFS